MQNGNGKLKIYTVISQQEEQQRQPRKIRLNWLRRARTQPKVGADAAQAAPIKAAPKTRRAARIRKIRPKSARKPLGATEKLLRNSAVACALLLTVMALQNINQPWTRTTTEKIKQAVTMRIDLDESLGRLNFVRGLVPDAALVFWNMGGSESLQLPVNGTVAHEFAEMQPWVEFVCGAQEPVVAAYKGTVSAVGQGTSGDWTLMLDHENGVQTVYAYMAQVLVKPGQQVERGAQLGITEDADTSRLYFELRKNGTPADPSKGA